MLTLIHPRHGVKFVPPTEQLLNVQNDLMNGYKLVREAGTAVYISVDQGVFWVRHSNARDELPKIRTYRGGRYYANRETLSVPRKWITSSAIDIGTALHNQLLEGAESMKLTKIKLQASGFEPEYFDTRNPQIRHLLYKLQLGNTCLALPMNVDFGDAKGVYVHQRAYQFELSLGNSSMRVPHVYENNGSLWVPLDFITTAADSCTTQQTGETTMDLVSLVMAAELFAITVEFSKGGQRYTYKSQTEIEVGAQVVVDSPTSGLVVVTVVACEKGLDTNVSKFPAYKWVVTTIDTTEYNRLRSLEHTMVEKAKAKQRLDAAKKQLEELGVTPEELIAMVKGND